MAINVIIPIKDTPPEYFKDCLLSLAIQTKKNFITTVIDDGSSEENKAIYSSLINDMPFEVIYLENKGIPGPGMARQLGLDKAPAPVDYFTFLDSDDMLYPRAIELLYTEVKVNKAELVSANLLVQGRHRSKDGYLIGNEAVSWLTGKAYNRKFLEDNDIRFIPDVFYAEDSYFNLVVFNLVEKNYHIDETIYYWRNNKDSATRSKDYVFSEKISLDLYTSQLRAAEKILKHKPNWNIGAIMGVMYAEYQYAQVREIEEEILTMEELLKPWLRREDVIEQLRKPEVQTLTYSKLKQDKEGYIFQESYADWLIRMTAKS